MSTFITYETQNIGKKNLVPKKFFDSILIIIFPLKVVDKNIS